MCYVKRMPSIPPGGTSPAAAFDVQAFAVQIAPAAILADSIDPITGDYTSLVQGRPLADAYAIEALRVQRGTGAAVRDQGNRYRELTHVDDEAIELVESMTREAFADAEQAGVARLVRVVAEADESDPAQINTYLEFRDLLAPADAPVRRLVFGR